MTREEAKDNIEISFDDPDEAVREAERLVDEIYNDFDAKLEELMELLLFMKHREIQSEGLYDETVYGDKYKVTITKIEN